MESHYGILSLMQLPEVIEPCFPSLVSNFSAHPLFPPDVANAYHSYIYSVTLMYRSMPLLVFCDMGPAFGPAH